MAEDLMAGYVAYTNAHDIVAEAATTTVTADDQSLTVTVSATYSWTVTW